MTHIKSAKNLQAIIEVLSEPHTLEDVLRAVTRVELVSEGRSLDLRDENYEFHNELINKLDTIISTLANLSVSCIDIHKRVKSLEDN